MTETELKKAAKEIQEFFRLLNTGISVYQQSKKDLDQVTIFMNNFKHDLSGLENRFKSVLKEILKED